MALSPGDSAVSLKSVLLMRYSLAGDRPTGRSQFAKKICQEFARDCARGISRSINVEFQPKPILRGAGACDCNSLRADAQPAAGPCAHGPPAESIQVWDSVSSHPGGSNIHLKNEVPPIRINRYWDVVTQPHIASPMIRLRMSQYGAESQPDDLWNVLLGKPPLSEGGKLIHALDHRANVFNTDHRIDGSLRCCEVTIYPFG